MNDFEKIPDEVWKLFDEIINYGKPVVLLTGTERAYALGIAWGWEPALLKRSSDSLLTNHGLAAYAWNELRRKKQVKETPATTKFKAFPPNASKFDEKDVPAEFRDCGKLDGTPLTGPYLEDSDEWRLKRPYLSKAITNGKLTNFIKVGKAHAYRYDELLILREQRLRKS